MSNIRQFPLREQRYDEASRWIARLDRELSASETRELQQWMAADAENAAVLESMARVWDKMDTLSRLSDLFPVHGRRRNHRALHLHAIAASILIAVTAGIWIFVATGSIPMPWSNSGSDFANEIPDSVYETAIGEQSTVKLSDGSVVELNTNSLLRVHYLPDRRLLTLERGEINVRVAKDPSRPLSVFAADQVVEAVGTAFNVEITENQKVELVVTEGKVRVGVQTPAGKPEAQTIPPVLPETSRTVAAGEEAILGADDEEITPVTPEEIEVKLSWRDGNLIFKGEPLEDALAEVGRYTTVEFVFLDDKLRKRAVAGYFKAGDVDGLLEALRENFDIAYERVDDQIVLLDSP